MEGLGNLQLVRFPRPEQARVLIMADTLHPNPVTIRTNRGPQAEGAHQRVTVVMRSMSPLALYMLRTRV